MNRPTAMKGEKMDISYVQLLDQVRVHLDAFDELEARRSAAKRRVLIDLCEVQGLVPASPLRELHLLLPCGLCIGAVHTWAQMQDLVDDLRPIVLRRLIGSARVCALHPQPSASE